jgi:hypothetical protein
MNDMQSITANFKRENGGDSRAARLPPSAFHLPPSALRLPPSAFRAGISLMEVLISVFVMSIGMLGLAALLPVGRVTILEAAKADRAGDCGRAALNEIKVRRMLDPYPNGLAYPQWLCNTTPSDGAQLVWQTTGGVTYASSFLIDPLGVLGIQGTGSYNFAGVGVPRVALRNVGAQAFLWLDDQPVTPPEDLTDRAPPNWPANWPWPPTRSQWGTYHSELPASDTATPRWWPYAPTYGGSGPPPVGDYSWFATVTPAAVDANLPQISQKTHFSVSAVVCYKRDFNEYALPIHEQSANPPLGFLDVANGMALSGGNLMLDVPINNDAISIKENDWVALYSSAYRILRWYRVAAIGEGGKNLALSGPDWQISPNASSYPDYIITLGKSVIGVYTTDMTLDQDPAWR